MDQNNKNQESVKIETFTGGLGFILACIGSAVGLGNIWRFPLMISEFGGLTFLVPYILFVIGITYTGLVEEYALGRASGKGPIGAFGWCCIDKGKEKIGRFIGSLPVIGALGLAIGYTVIVAWVFQYLYMAIMGQLEPMGQNIELLKGAFAYVSTGSSTSIIIATMICAVIMGAGIASGIEKANKILLPMLFGLFLLLATYIAFLPGASDGYNYIFTLKPDRLCDYRLWVFAFGQAFFSLSLTGNINVIFGSYLPKSENIPGSAYRVAFFDTLAALLATFVIIPAMATSGETISQGGPGMMFIYLIRVFNNMPGGFFVSLLFFISVTSAGITTLITIYEAPIALAKKKLHLSRWGAVVVITAIGCVIAILIQDIAPQMMDILSIYLCPICAFLAAIMFFWMLDKQKALDAVNEGAKPIMGDFFYNSGKYAYCLATLVILILGFFMGSIG